MTISKKTDSSWHVLNTCHLPDAILNAVYGEIILMHTTTLERGVDIMTILQMKILRHRESKHFTQRHTANE